MYVSMFLREGDARVSGKQTKVASDCAHAGFLVRALASPSSDRGGRRTSQSNQSNHQVGRARARAGSAWLRPWQPCAHRRETSDGGECADKQTCVRGLTRGGKSRLSACYDSLDDLTGPDQASGLVSARVGSVVQVRRTQLCFPRSFLVASANFSTLFTAFQ
jgi:hypothetical protein